jgi:hypothetical protein
MTKSTDAYDKWFAAKLEEWKQLVANDETRLGLWDWIEAEEEMEASA